MHFTSFRQSKVHRAEPCTLLALGRVRYIYTHRAEPCTESEVKRGSAEHSQAGNGVSPSRLSCHDSRCIADVGTMKPLLAVTSSRVFYAAERGRLLFWTPPLPHPLTPSHPLPLSLIPRQWFRGDEGGGGEEGGITYRDWTPQEGNIKKEGSESQMRGVC